MISTRVSLILGAAFLLALLAFWGIHRATVRRSFDLVHTETLRDGLEIGREATREAFAARAGANVPTDTLRRRLETVERGLLIIEELRVLEEELGFYLAVLGAAPFVVLFLAFYLVTLVWVRRLFRPLNAATAAVRRYAEHDAGGFPLPDEGTADVRVLRRALNEMVGTIRLQAAAIASQNRAQGWREVAREVVHESKTLLTPLRLSAEGLVERAFGARDEATRREGESILAGLRALERMNGSLRDLSNRRVPELAPVPLRPLLLSSAELHGRPGVGVDAAIEGEPVVLADATLLEEAVANLVTNAVEARAKSITLAAQPAGDEVRIECRDDGDGIPPEHRQRVTKLAFTTKPSGSGFGLYFAEKLALELGGRLEIDSEPGSGTTVRMVLPDADAPHRR